MTEPNLALVAAPMVNQSDLPFRLLARKYGATMSYTQMLMPNKLLNDQDYLEFHLRNLTVASDDPFNAPVIVQLCGNESGLIVQAGRKLQNYCTAVGAYLNPKNKNCTHLNLGCPQEPARDGHYGAYLLPQKDWPLVQEIVSAMHHSLTVPVSAKLRLCQPAIKTLDLAQKIEYAGASWMTLHARTVSARRRRQGAADLLEVKRLKQGLRIPVISNGNVRVWGDLKENLDLTRADGLMVGETLLGNPCLFSGPAVPDPVDISLEYLSLCKKYPDTATLKTIQTHVRHCIDFQCSRRTWFNKFKNALSATTTIEDIENLLLSKVEKWRGRQQRRMPTNFGHTEEMNSSRELDEMDDTF